MRIILTAMALAFSIITCAQENVQPKIPNEAQEIDTLPEVGARIDWVAWSMYLHKHLGKTKWSDSLAKLMLRTQIIIDVRFAVNEYGKITDVSSKNDSTEFREIAIRIIKSYPGVWTPALRGGKPVKSYLNQQVNFGTPTKLE